MESQQAQHAANIELDAMQLLPRHRYMLQKVDAAFGIYDEDLTEVMFFQEGIINKVPRVVRHCISAIVFRIKDGREYLNYSNRCAFAYNTYQRWVYQKPKKVYRHRPGTLLNISSFQNIRVFWGLFRRSVLFLVSGRTLDTVPDGLWPSTTCRLLSRMIPPSIIHGEWGS